LLQCHRVKIFADGALGSETAALSQPYVIPHRCSNSHSRSGSGSHSHSHSHNHTHDNVDPSARPLTPPSPLTSSTPCDGSIPVEEVSAASLTKSIPSSTNYGILIHNVDSLTQCVRSAHEKGYRIEMHVIGDRAAELGLQAFEQVGLTPRDRPILTHCQVLRQDLVERMSRLGVIADIQPQFTVTDSRWAQARLPATLLPYAYAWKTLLEQGVHLAGGSDSPIELASPFFGNACSDL